MKYAVVDLSNLFFSVRFATMGDADSQLGMAFHILFRSLKKLYKETNVDHIVFAVDYSSWRYTVYPAYKGKRKLDRLEKSIEDQEQDKMFLDAMNDLVEFLDKKTNCTVLKQYQIEADDFVAGWVQSHPNDEHIIVSADSDFVQLLDKNVSIYDGVKNLYITIDQITNIDNKKMSFEINTKNGKIKIGSVDNNFVPETDWWKKALFLKIIRGDIGDGIYPAYPKVRYNGSSKKVGINEAWNDHIAKGFDWNNFMLSEWQKPLINGTVENVKVKDSFAFNELLIDLTKQPDDVKQKMFETILEKSNKKNIKLINLHFLKFCGKYDLPQLAAEAIQHSDYLSKE